jgi:phage/plasmid-associated DNA primase
MRPCGSAKPNWIRERCKRIEYGGTASSKLYGDWCIWSKAAGEDSGSQKRFSQALEDNGYAKDRKLERTLAMLFRLRELRLPAAAA